VGVNIPRPPSQAELARRCGRAFHHSGKISAGFVCQPVMPAVARSSASRQKLFSLPSCFFIPIKNAGETVARNADSWQIDAPD